MLRCTKGEIAKFSAEIARNWTFLFMHKYKNYTVVVHNLTKDIGYASEMKVLPKLSNYTTFRNHHCAKFYINA